MFCLAYKSVPVWRSGLLLCYIVMCCHLLQPMVSPEEVVKHAQIEVQKLEAQAQAQAIAAVQVSAAAQRAEAEAQKYLVVHAQVAAQAQQLQAKAVHLQVGWLTMMEWFGRPCIRVVLQEPAYLQQYLVEHSHARSLCRIIVPGHVVWTQVLGCAWLPSLKMSHVCCLASSQVHADQLTTTAVAAEVAVATAAANVTSSTSGAMPASAAGLGSATVAVPSGSGLSPNLMSTVGMNPMIGTAMQQVSKPPCQLRSPACSCWIDKLGRHYGVTIATQ